MSLEEWQRLEQRMELMDSLPEPARLLVHEYGLAAAHRAVRQFYGRWAQAKAYLEAERQQLQVQRWKNIK